MSRRAAVAIMAALAAGLASSGLGSQSAGVDTALALAVDVSSSVDEERFRLQMEGIAKALEAPEIQQAILGGAHGAILVSLVQWADRQVVSVPWTRVGSPAEALALAARIRGLTRQPGEFTCAGAMLRFVAVKLVTSIPVVAERRVVDVSGDGRDNCNSRVATEQERDALVAEDVTINGLPILDGPDAATLEDWYRTHIVGGPAAFTLPAAGYADFGRAIRQKFLTEISAR